MGEAKRLREAGKALGPTELDRKQAMQDELHRIERQRNGDALAERRFGVIPQEYRPKEAK